MAAHFDEQEMAAQGSEQVDPVEKLFDGLPTMNHWTTINWLASGYVLDKLRTFVTEAESVPASSLDTDCSHLLKYASEAVEESMVHCFLTGIADLAVKTEIRADDHSRKANYLRYFRWLAMGRKDEESPYEQEQITDKVDHAHLPENPSDNECAGCGSTDSELFRCSGCLVQTEDGKTVFVTAYCGRACQMAHWKAHRVFCRELQQLHRAACTFREVYTLFLEFTADPSGLPTEIREENGMIQVVYPTSWREIGLGYRGESILCRDAALKGPSAPSKEAWLAAHLTERSGEATRTTRPIFDLFIGRKCSVLRATHHQVHI
jgi:hypothetical protein